MKNLLFILTFCVLLGCTTTQYVPVEHTKVEYINSVQIDTCIIKDSIYIREGNDTMYVEKFKYIYNNILTKDTIIVNDTIPTIKTIEITKEINVVKNWQMALMVLGGAFIVFLLFRIKKFLGI